ncbi:hypothetical protein GLOTRDRAFT_141615 [Gloeophyllum trabeum ATCC 11539]|uniref:DUF6534 domain-containing protein n=1 Tax=Gloeophyllum trabeum (strain ATCC 11539 / FP-39264 / Madison 617) TaxID=670483 RepID=S7PQR3_GLOTA|nr:uncharacterized protein GLOTRDRAFT_141615 [Gloeophyllum trabeum ATCC 11539]EPQ50151.1 hypothetical protein GLOTRDRAFT_141615 [Gloeophyllum trabeum ATCC 11539]
MPMAMVAIQAVAPHFVLDNTMGAMFVGVIVAATLYGVSCVQTWFYYNHYRNDLWHIKLLVAASFISDTIHQALISHTMYTYVVTNFANPAILQRLVWSLLVEVLFNGFTALMVQVFFTIRIWKLSERNVPITVSVLLLVLAEFGAVIAYTIKSLTLETFAELELLKGLSMSVNGLAAAGDVAIAIVLCTMLHRSRTGFRQSDTMITKLIIFCVNTGLLTSACAVLSLVFIAALPNTFIYICFYFTLGRLYLNSLLATLNARKSIRSTAGGPSDFSENLSLPLTEVNVRREASVGVGRPIAVRIDTCTETVKEGRGGGVEASPVTSDSVSKLDVESASDHVLPYKFEGLRVQIPMAK